MSRTQQIGKLVRHHRGLQVGLAAAILAATVAVANATDRYWNSAVNGNWQDTSSWSGGVVPGYGDGAYVTSGGTCTINSSTVAQCSTFGIGNMGSASIGTVLQTGGSLDVQGAEMIGCSYASGGYSYTQSGGTNNAGAFWFGYTSSSSFSGWNSTYSLNGGTLTVGSMNRSTGYTSTAFNLGGGTLRASADFTCPFPLSLTSAAGTIDTQGNAVTLSQALSGAAGGFTKAGSGTLTLSGGNTYGGGTTIGAGTLAYGVDNAVPGNVTVNGGELSLGAYNGMVGTVTLQSGSITGSGGTLTGTGGFAVQGGTISANLAGDVGLTKTTAGTVVLTGGLNYTGETIIQGGTLQAVGLGGIGLLAGNGLDIQHGQAVLDYTGLLPPATVETYANEIMQAARANGWNIDSTHPVGSTTAATDPLVHALGWTDTVVAGATC